MRDEWIKALRAVADALIPAHVRGPGASATPASEDELAGVSFKLGSLADALQRLDGGIQHPALKPIKAQGKRSSSGLEATVAGWAEHLRTAHGQSVTNADDLVAGWIGRERKGGGKQGKAGGLITSWRKKYQTSADPDMKAAYTRGAKGEFYAVPSGVSMTLSEFEKAVCAEYNMISAFY